MGGYGRLAAALDMFLVKERAILSHESLAMRMKHRKKGKRMKTLGTCRRVLAMVGVVLGWIG